MTEHIKAVITEEVYAVCWESNEDPKLIESNKFSIELNHWDDFVQSNKFAASYVEDIISAIKDGSTNIYTSRKYMFSDMMSSYKPLITDLPDHMFDKVVEVYVSNL